MNIIPSLSTLNVIKCRVPKGSILGLVLFLFSTSVICAMCQRPWISCYLPITLTYFISAKTQIN